MFCYEEVKFNFSDFQSSFQKKKLPKSTNAMLIYPITLKILISSRVSSLRAVKTSCFRESRNPGIWLKSNIYMLIKYPKLTCLWTLDLIFLFSFPLYPCINFVSNTILHWDTSCMQTCTTNITKGSIMSCEDWIYIIWFTLIFQTVKHGHRRNLMNRSSQEFNKYWYSFFFY